MSSFVQSVAIFGIFYMLAIIALVLIIRTQIPKKKSHK